MGGCPHLECIHIPGNPIGSSGVEALVTLYKENILKTCRSLDLSFNQIGDDGIVSLAHLFNDPHWIHTLEYLDISNNRIHNKGFQVFLNHFGQHVHAHLKHINISCNELKS